MRSNADRFFNAAFGVSLTFLAVLVGFAYGTVMMHYKMWPYEGLKTAEAHIQTYLISGQWAPEGLFIPAPPGASRQRAIVHEPRGLMSGYRAIMGRDPDAEQYAIWLLDGQGRQLHTWPIDYEALDPDGPSNGTDMPHGMKVLEDGSILVNFDYGDVMARLGACGEAIWVRRGIFHHSIEPSEDGTFWTWRAADGTTPFSHFQYLVNFDAETGATLKEYSLVDDFIEQSSESKMIFGLPEGFQYRKSKIGSMDRLDVFHPNDVEPLSSALAPMFPGFRPGDLLISLKANNLVAVLDPLTQRVKWWSHGPWRLQHDPDFGPDGKIWVYNNNGRGERSELIAIDPESRRVETAFSGDSSKFYSHSMGKHQRLPNGNAIITSPYEGRILETRRSGDIVFEFNNIHDREFNLHVENAIWLPENYFRSFPSCSQ